MWVKCIKVYRFCILLWIKLTEVHLLLHSYSLLAISSMKSPVFWSTWFVFLCISVCGLVWHAITPIEWTWYDCLMLYFLLLKFQRSMSQRSNRGQNSVFRSCKQSDRNISWMILKGQWSRSPVYRDVHTFKICDFFLLFYIFENVKGLS